MGGGFKFPLGNLFHQSDDLKAVPQCKQKKVEAERADRTREPSPNVRWRLLGEGRDVGAERCRPALAGPRQQLAELAELSEDTPHHICSPIASSAALL